MVSEDEFLTTLETARLLRTSSGALYMQRARRELPGLLGVRMGRQLLFRRSDLDGWIEARIGAQLANLKRPEDLEVGESQVGGRLQHSRNATDNA